jgi:hypothetical protein
LGSARRKYFDISYSGNDLRLSAIGHRYPVGAYLRWPNRDAGRVEFNIGATRSQHSEGYGPVAQSDLEAIGFQIRHGHIRRAADPEKVAGIELDFHARVHPGRDPIACHDRRIDCRGNPLAGIPALDRSVSANKTNPGDTSP